MNETFHTIFSCILLHTSAKHSVTQSFLHSLSIFLHKLSASNMKVLVVLVVIVLLIQFISAQDHLWIVLTFPRGYCAYRNCRRLRYVNEEVVVHGLWPVDSAGSTSTLLYCTNINSVRDPKPDV